MKPPVTIETLMEQWAKDAPVDDTEPQSEIIKIPILRAKYLHILTHHRMMVKKLELDYKKRRYILSEYFEGNLNNKEDLDTYGFKEPCLYKPGVRVKVPQMLDSNEELNNILIKKICHQEIVDCCEDIIKELNARTYQIRAHMDWRKFMSDAN